MGKNPNAKKLKERKHKERTFEHDIEDLEEEAARLGITLEELQEQRGIGQDSSSDEDEQPKKKAAAKKKKLQDIDEEEEEEPAPKK